MKGLDLKLRERMIAYLSAACLLLLLLPGQAAAQGQTVLAVTPAEAEVVTAAQFRLNLTLTDAVALNAFDIKVEYNGALLRLDGWTNGGFLSNLSVVVLSNEPGSFRLVCTQLATEGATGSGELVLLNFTALAQGQTDITITKAELSDKQSTMIIPALVDGHVTVHDPGMGTPQPTQTEVQPTPVLPTQTPQPTTPITYPIQTTQPVLTTPQATLLPAPTDNPYLPPMRDEDQPLLTVTLPATLPAGQEPTLSHELLTGTQVPSGTQPLRNSDLAGRWQPAAGDLLPWVLLGVELAALAGLLVLLMRRRP